MLKHFAWLVCVYAVASAAPLQAQEPLNDPAKSGDVLARFTGPRWSQIRPARDFEGGCVVGFLSFRFEPTGYFMFNNRVRGAWWVDELGNLKLRTRDGERFTLIVEGNTLRPNKNLSFMRRTFMYQRCPN